MVGYLVRESRTVGFPRQSLSLGRSCLLAKGLPGPAAGHPGAPLPLLLWPLPSCSWCAPPPAVASALLFLAASCPLPPDTWAERGAGEEGGSEAAVAQL